MNFVKELHAMEDRMFDAALLDRILAAHRQEMDELEDDRTEQEYQQAKAALPQCLDKRQKVMLEEMEALFHQNTRYMFRFAFSRGVYAAFQHFFCQQGMEDAFSSLVGDQILVEPNMRREIPFYEVRTKINRICQDLEDRLDEAAKEHLVSVYTAWEERGYGVLRYSFYLGHRYGCSLQRAVEPNHAFSRMLAATLLTEHELGFTWTKEERDRYRQKIDARR